MPQYPSMYYCFPLRSCPSQKLGVPCNNDHFFVNQFHLTQDWNKPFLVNNYWTGVFIRRGSRAASPAGQLADFTDFITLWKAEPHCPSLGRAHVHCHCHPHGRGLNLSGHKNLNSGSSLLCSNCSNCRRNLQLFTLSCPLTMWLAVVLGVGKDTWLCCWPGSHGQKK